MPLDQAIKTQFGKLQQVSGPLAQKPSETSMQKSFQKQPLVDPEEKRIRDYLDNMSTNYLSTIIGDVIVDKNNKQVSVQFQENPKSKTDVKYRMPSLQSLNLPLGYKFYNSMIHKPYNW